MLNVKQVSKLDMSMAFKVPTSKNLLEANCVSEANDSRIFIVEQSALYKDLCAASSEIIWNSATAAIEEETLDIGQNCYAVSEIVDEELVISFVGYCPAKFVGTKANTQAKLLKARNECEQVYFDYRSGAGDGLIGVGSVFAPFFGNIVRNGFLSFGYSIRTKDFQYVPCNTPCINSYCVEIISTVNNQDVTPLIEYLTLTSSNGIDMFSLATENQIISTTGLNAGDYVDFTNAGPLIEFANSISERPTIELASQCALFTPCFLNTRLPQNLDVSQFANGFNVYGKTDDGRRFNLGSSFVNDTSSDELQAIPIDLSEANLSTLDEDIACALMIGM